MLKENEDFAKLSWVYKKVGLRRLGGQNLQF